MMDKEKLKELLVDEEFTEEDFNNLSEDEVKDLMKLCDVLDVLNKPTGNEEMLIQELKDLEFIDVQYIKWYQKPFYALKYYLIGLYNKIKGIDEE